MQLPRTECAQMRRRLSDERGFILIMTGLLIIPIVAFTALAIDVSAWYSRATELQRGADAGSLAGVVWMPNLGKARDAATPILQRNGFVDGAGDIAIEMVVGDQTDSSFKVCITDKTAPQFFSIVFTGPTSLTRCSVAKYNLPLVLGSSGNSIGGFQNGFAEDPGHGPIPATPAHTEDKPPGNDYTIDPDNYATAQSPNYQWYYYNTRLKGCKAVTSTGSNGRVFGYYWAADGTRNGGTNSRLDGQAIDVYRSGQSYYYFYASMLPDCVWTHPATPAQPAEPPSYTIRPDMRPGYWASVEAPGTDAVQGDQFSTKCYGSGYTTACGSGSSTANPDYTTMGQYYTLSINANNPSVLIQVFDAAYDEQGQANGTGDNRFNDSGTWTTHYQMYKVDQTPYDPTDNDILEAGSCGNGAEGADNSGQWSLTNNYNSSNRSSYYHTWRTLCTLTSPPVTQDNNTFLLRIWTDGTGNASNNFALRAIAANSADNLDQYNYPLDALPNAEQPTLSPWQHMTIYTNLPGGDATFFLAKVDENYAGKTLVMDLYDAGEGAQSLTINTPTGKQMGCTYASSKLANVNGGGSNGGGSINTAIGLTTIPPTQVCKINTVGRFNGNLLTVRMQIPDSSIYSCDKTVRPLSTLDSDLGCWWSITYSTSSDTHDETTWGAHIEGNPVRLVE